MPSSGLGAYQVKIHQIVFGGLFFLVVLMGVRAMMAGGVGNLRLLAALSVSVGVILALDKYYWVLGPLFFTSELRMPGLPFNGMELGCIVLISVYFVRQAMHKEHPMKLTGAILAALPIFCWICMIWMINPTGMAMLGSSRIGARFYFQILLGFGAFLVLSSLRLSERDCRILFYVLLGSALYSFGQTVFLERIADWASGSDRDNELMSRYELLGALSFYTLLFSRYRLSQISTSLWKLLAAVGLAGVSIYTGKRRAFGTLVVVPYLRCFFTGRDKMLTVAWSVVGAVLLMFAIAGHGTFYELPLSAQRALAVIVPSFAEKTAGGLHDYFREEVRRYGNEVIRSSPWVGRKGFSMDRGETSWIVFSGVGDLYSGHAYTGNWHSVWYAYACDFGLPAMFFWACFVLYAAVWTYRGFRTVVFGTYANTVYIYYAFALFLSLVFSYTSGHSAHTACGTWIAVGMLYAIQNGAEKKQSPVVLESA
ncbi:MAG: hypothetical protein ACOX9C_00900 [Kiritimatiellia bacterium]|jgi:hypothetical protein